MMSRIESSLAGFALCFAVACGGGGGDDGGPGGGDIDAGGNNGGDPDSAVIVDPNNPLAGHCTVENSDFSFFVTSMDALWKLAGTPIDDLGGGFGGDFGGLAGADEICQKIGEATGHGSKTWRAFLSATDDGNGNQVHAIERIGTGPWHDANGRMVAANIAGLQNQDGRPDGDARIIQDLPDECGVPISQIGDVHDVITGSNVMGRLARDELNATCNDWTSSDDNVGTDPDGQFGLGPVMCGHSFPRRGTNPGQAGYHWSSDHGLRGCGKGAALNASGPGMGTCVGCSGGYGALYCFAQ